MNLIKQKDPKATNYTVKSAHSYISNTLTRTNRKSLIQDWLLKLYKSMYLILRAKLVSELKSILSGSLFHAFKTRSLKKMT